MPFFYKLTGYDDEKRDEWLEKISFTIADFIEGCNETTGVDGVVIFIFQIPFDEIRHHHKQYEYVSDNAIPSDYILDLQQHVYRSKDIKPEIINGITIPYMNDRSERIFAKYIEDTLDIYENVKDDLYLHITCESFYESILQNGLYSNDTVTTRIGDREEEQDQEQEYDDMELIEGFEPSDFDFELNDDFQLGGKKHKKSIKNKKFRKSRKNKKSIKSRKHKQSRKHKKSIKSRKNKR